MAPNPAESLGPYQLVRCIGAGGMGQVWLARLKDWPEPVVVKRLHSALAADTRLVDRFLDEMLVMRRLRHRNVVRLLDGGHIGTTYYLVMEYVDGLTLHECLDANGAPLQPGLAIELVAQACAGLAHAFSAVDERGKPLQLIHRDISPDNLMVDRNGVVRVLDFGIARAACSLATTQFDLRRGKLRYAAPEYIEFGRTDPRVDVYSMGVTLYELCTGGSPFAGCTDPVQLMHLICRVGLPAVNEARPDLPNELAQVIGDATRLHPEERIASIAELGWRLDELRARHPAPSLAKLGMTVTWWMNRLDPAPELSQDTVVEQIASLAAPQTERESHEARTLPVEVASPPPEPAPQRSKSKPVAEPPFPRGGKGRRRS